MLIRSTDYRRQEAGKAYGLDSGKTRGNSNARNADGEEHGAVASRASSGASPFSRFTSSRLSSGNTTRMTSMSYSSASTTTQRGILAYQSLSSNTGNRRATSTVRSSYSPVSSTPSYSSGSLTSLYSSFSPASILQSGISAYQNMGPTSYSSSAIRTGASLYKSAGSLMMNTGNLFLSF